MATDDDLENSVETMPASLFRKGPLQKFSCYNRVIWDLDSDSIYSGWLIRKQVEYVLRKDGFFWVFDINVYVDDKNAFLLRKLEDAVFPIISSGKQDEKLNMMLIDITFWAMNHHCNPGNLLIITENKNFGHNSKKQDKFSPIRQSMLEKGFNVALLTIDTLMGLDIKPFIIKPEHLGICPSS